MRKIVNRLLVLKLVKLLNGDFIFFVVCLEQFQTLCEVRNPNIPNLGQGVPIDQRTCSLTRNIFTSSQDGPV